MFVLLLALLIGAGVEKTGRPEIIRAEGTHMTSAANLPMASDIASGERDDLLLRSDKGHWNCYLIDNPEKAAASTCFRMPPPSDVLSVPLLTFPSLAP